ncbi:MAG TPA: class I tRNA ligase family protein, partial [Candidatus Manganitrophaceae bacterium]|nr:class I tRNA ligase family protein [Candidatus Manganitrophaceae bacterium]
NPGCKEPGRPIVTTAAPEKCPHCGSADLRQDPDVLDTWFSSALWPFSTLGWPPELQPDPAARSEAEQLLKTFYPTSTLVSGFDILFFWVARMIMMGLHFMKEVPFRDVYIHALVRDAEGQKMSKSKGNVIDPLEIMGQYGTDALRFTLASMASPGRDIKLSEERIEGYRNFANKLWNAARFALMNLPEGERFLEVPPSDSIVDRWIQSRLQRTAGLVNEALEKYRFDEAAAALYQFTWHEFCDWYLELIKVDLQEGDEAQKRATRKTLRETFEAILRLLHPFMPFITEELRPYFSEEKGSLAVAAYPAPETGGADLLSEEAVEKLIATIDAVRNLRGEMNIPPSEELSLFIKTGEENGARYRRYLPYIKRLARISDMTLGAAIERPRTATTVATKEATLYIPLEENRLRKEKERIEKVLAKSEKEMEPLQKRLGDENFRAKAPEAYQKLEGQVSEKREQYKKMKKNYEQILDMLSGSK